MTDPSASPSDAALWDLENLARARGLCDWIYAQYAHAVRGHVAEVGAGIGTFSARLLDGGAERLLLIEPEAACVERLERRFGADERVQIAAETLPDSAALSASEGQLDLVVSQNVHEHIGDDRAATASLARALRPGGQLTVLVPAHPRLYGNLDRTYGHHRRYTRRALREVVESAGLVVEDVYSFNLLGIPGWWVQSRRRSPSVGAGALRAYEALLKAWRPIESRVRPPWGLSVIAHARKPGG